MVNGLRRAWTWIQSHPLVGDALLAAALFGVALVSARATIDVIAGDPSYRAPDSAALVAGLAAMVVPLTWRRRAPLAVLLACTAGFLLSRIVVESPEGTMTSIVLSIAVYSAAAHGRPRWRTWACAICLLAVMAELARELSLQTGPGGPDLLLYDILGVLLFNLALFCAMWALGGALGAGRRRAAELLERTRELEHEREENARRAVFDERVRIARDLHDVVAHHVSLMGVQAGAARMISDRDAAKARQALASIETSSRQAVLELHRLLGYLRRSDEPEDPEPQPGLGHLPALAASMRGSDLAVQVRIEGEERSLPPTVDVSAYRIVQEALTNTLKHSVASRADVHLRYRPGELELEIVDDGRGTAPPPSGPGGLGLVGMRERAALHGGQLTAGPAAQGGFAVRVRLPTPVGAL